MDFDWAKILRTSVRGVDILGDVGGLMKIFERKRAPEHAATPDKNGEKGSEANPFGFGLDDERLFLGAWFDNIADRELSKDEAMAWVDIMDFAGTDTTPALTKNEKLKLCQLIGFKETEIVTRKPLDLTDDKGRTRTIIDEQRTLTNLKGRKVMIGLIQLGPEGAVRFLAANHLLDNQWDKAAETLAKSKGVASLAAKYGDSSLHVGMAWRHLGWSIRDLRMILATPEVESASDAIDEAADGKPKLDAHEAFQAALLRAVAKYNTRPGWIEHKIALRKGRRATNFRILGWFLGASIIFVLSLNFVLG